MCTLRRGCVCACQSQINTFSVKLSAKHVPYWQRDSHAVYCCMKQMCRPLKICGGGDRCYNMLHQVLIRVVCGNKPSSSYSLTLLNILEASTYQNVTPTSLPQQQRVFNLVLKRGQLYSSSSISFYRRRLLLPSRSKTKATVLGGQIASSFPINTLMYCRRPPLGAVVNANT